MWETDSEQVLWRKDEKNFEKRVKRLEIVEKEAVEIYSSAEVGGSCLTIAGCQHLIGCGLYLGKRLPWAPSWGKMRPCDRKGFLHLVWFAGQCRCAGGSTTWGCFVRFCQNGFYRPVLKHGPRSLTYMRVCWWRNQHAKWRWLMPSRKVAASTDHDPLVKGLSKSISVRTRKMVNYAWVGWSQGKLWWRLVAVLTCKSFVKLGYRGERLIEPSSSWFPPKFPSG